MLATNSPAKNSYSDFKRTLKKKTSKINRMNGQRIPTGKSLIANEHIKQC